MSKPPRRFWTSDQHIGHDFVAKIRGFAWSKSHDAALAAAWDDIVRPNDIVYVLGDISINPRRDGAFRWFAERPGVKHLVTGNHDEVHPLFGSRAVRARARALSQLAENVERQLNLESWGDSWFDVFATIDSMGMTTLNGERLMMSHFPYSGEGLRSLPERYSEFRLRDMGHLLVHGHTHSSAAVSDHPRSVHVGVDAWGWAPVSEASLVATFQKMGAMT